MPHEPVLEMLRRELQFAIEASKALPKWKKEALENAKRVERKLGYIR